MKDKSLSTLRFKSYWMLWVLVIPQIVGSTVVGAFTGMMQGIHAVHSAFEEWDYYNK